MKQGLSLQTHVSGVFQRVFHAEPKPRVSFSKSFNPNPRLTHARVLGKLFNPNPRLGRPFIGCTRQLMPFCLSKALGVATLRPRHVDIIAFALRFHLEHHTGFKTAQHVREVDRYESLNTPKYLTTDSLPPWLQC